MSKTTEVVALEAGHDGVSYRNKGETWHVPADQLDGDGKDVDGRTWFVAVEVAPAPKKAGRPPGAGPAKGSRVVDDHGGDVGAPAPGAGPRRGD